MYVFWDTSELRIQLTNIYGGKIMQTLNYKATYQNGNLVELNQYRAARTTTAEGLPPLPRRKHRCPLGLHMSDLLSMGMAAMTIIATGMIVAGM